MNSHFPPNVTYENVKIPLYFQTCLKRIRLDLPIIHEDFISNDGKNISLFLIILLLEIDLVGARVD